MYLSVYFYRHTEYLTTATQKLANQPLLTLFRANNDSAAYGARHPRQTAITDALINDLVIGCSLPLSIVENEKFRHFLAVIDSRYTPLARATIAQNLRTKLQQLSKI